MSAKPAAAKGSPGKPSPARSPAKSPARSSAKSPAGSPAPVATLPLPALIATAVGLAVLGFVVGGGGAFLQAATVTVGVRWPTGCVFVLAVLGAVSLSAGLLTRSRLGVGMVAIGWVISVLVFTAGRPEGDVIIAADVPGYLYLFGGIAVLALTSVVPFSAVPAAERPAPPA